MPENPPPAEAEAVRSARLVFAPPAAPPNDVPAVTADPARNATAPAPGPASNGSPGWAPPPRPGLVPLRPLGLGIILSASFTILRKSPGATLAPAALLSLGTAAIGVGLSVLSDSSDVGDSVSALTLDALRVNALLLLGFFISVVVDGLAAVAVAQGALGRRMGFRAVVVRVRGRDKVLVGWALLLTTLVAAVLVAMRLVGHAAHLDDGSAPGVGGILLTILGTPLLVVCGVLLGNRVIFVPAVLLVEKRGLGGAIRRAWTLTRGAGTFWRILGIRLLVWIMLVIASAVALFPFTLLLQFGGTLLFPNGGEAGGDLLELVSLVVTAIVPAITAAIGAVVAGATVGLLYLDVRMRREGLDLELARHVESATVGSDDPYLPRIG